MDLGGVGPWLALLWWRRWRAQAGHDSGTGVGHWRSGAREQRAQAGTVALERVTAVLGHGVSGWSRWRGRGCAEAEASSAARAQDGDSGDVGAAKVRIRSMYGALRLNRVPPRVREGN